MKRALYSVVAALVFAVFAAPTAAAGPEDVPVPNMKSGAALGAPCGSAVTWVFGWDANGNVLACRRPFPKDGYQWVDGGTLVGVREKGDSCILDVYAKSPDFREHVSAQTPDGYALFCEYPWNYWNTHPIA
ncbi:hypothetical protein A5662_10895 [Mycobacteriaceae bacterium 1482268.1]|nr:hypothetical protein A5662_10895 [Mycobacteriaceae bacterium 1482268.1]